MRAALKVVTPLQAAQSARPSPASSDADQGSTEPNPAIARLLESAGHLDTRPPVSRVVLTGTVRAVEAALLAVTGWAAAMVLAPAPERLVACGAIAGVTTATAVAWALLQVNRLQLLRQPRRALPLMLGAFAGASAIAGAGLAWWFQAPMTAVTWVGAWMSVGALALVASRVVVWRHVAALTRLGRLERRTVVVGGGKPGEELIEALAHNQDPDLRILGVFDDRNDSRSPLILAGYPKLGKVTDLVSLARKIRIDLIIFTLPITAEQRLQEMLKKLWVLPIDIRLAAHRGGLRFRPQSYSYIGGVPVLDMLDKPLADWDVTIKAVFDRVVGALALVALAPVLLLTAFAIKLDSRGPVLFRQPRYGFNNEIVEVFKFRSLYADKTDVAATKLVTKNDPRVTRVGRFIRKTSIDELPQLFNVVFKGNLSLVGPRPHAIKAGFANASYPEVVDGYFARHRVKPGITGWAQVNGWRGETDAPYKIQKRVEHDLEYIENWSILFDLWILLRTPVALLSTANAY